jgi:hypothetical protein
MGAKRFAQACGFSETTGHDDPKSAHTQVHTICNPQRHTEYPHHRARQLNTTQIMGGVDPALFGVKCFLSRLTDLLKFTCSHQGCGPTGNHLRCHCGAGQNTHPTARGVLYNQIGQPLTRIWSQPPCGEHHTHACIELDRIHHGANRARMNRDQQQIRFGR